MKYFEFAMCDGVSIMDQVHEMQIYVFKLKDLKIEIPEAIQVGAIIAKLPLSWNNYRERVVALYRRLSVDQLLKHLRIEEETRIRDKMFQVQPNSKVNFISEKNKNTNPNGVGKKRKSFDSDSNKRHVTCYNCGKKGISRKIAALERSKTKKVCLMFKWPKPMLKKSLQWFQICTLEWSQFKHYEDAAEGQQVLMGNANTAIVLGKGNIEVQFTSGKKMLTNVLHVPDSQESGVCCYLVQERFEDCDRG
ncbi:UNVERIFIED_CONTAM: hypothetical protein Slati_1332000 [Sesamum latifolium]|uniref:Retrovirus-related Pol polyprotein from transposon TNT 1-94-like beta-barrel domain-containing protein n=1 Tax=Sesamum latifolium TaxID=2727402 RepID=A0AAW2XK80_9LAMI